MQVLGGYRGGGVTYCDINGGGWTRTTMTRRIIKYFAPGYHDDPVEVSVDDQSFVLDVLEHFRNLAGSGAGFKSRVAFLPKNVALKINPVHDLSHRFTTVASHLKYPQNRDAIFSLELCDAADEENVQFFIRRHPDQPEFIPPGDSEEHNHLRIIQHAASRDLKPLSISNTVSEFKKFQGEHPVHNGRPADLTGPPITIYSDVFADIVDDLARLSDRPLDKRILAEIGSFACKSLAIYDSESERERALSPLIETLLGVKLTRDAHTSSLPTAAKSDAIVKENGAIYLHVECKNELGLSSIADFQGPLTLLKHIADPKYAAIRNNTCCPCIHLSIAGPYISFGASILTDMYIYQSFTNYIHLGGNPFLTRSIYDTARIFDIFRNALNKMRERYEGLIFHDTTSKDRSRLFPHPACVPNTTIPDLVFEKRIIPDENYPLPRRALFHATYHGQPVVVKFAERYHHDAHRAVAEKGLAPQLHFHTQLRGGVHMVIMDYIDGSDADHQFVNEELPESVVKQVEAALAVLHNENLVYGDVRRSNILVKMEPVVTSLESDACMEVDTPQSTQTGWRAFLVDFDWVGEAGKDRYTPLLNTEIPWPRGVLPGGLMELDHDIVMLQSITRAASQT